MIVLAALVVGAYLLNRETPPPGESPVSVRKAPKRTWKTGRMTLVIGASQSGKTHYVLSQIKGAKRLLIWDVEEQYADEPGITAVRSLAALAAILTKNPRSFRLAFVPSDNAEFAGFCRLAWFALECGLTHHDTDGKPLPTYLVAEEISDVTNPGKAPPEWGKLIRRGLKRNMWLYAVTQSPSESDKTTVKNCSEAHICGVQSEEEAEYLGRKLKVNADHIARLNREEKQFMHVNTVTGAVSYGGKTMPEFISDAYKTPINSAYKPPGTKGYNKKAKAPDRPAN